MFSNLGGVDVIRLSEYFTYLSLSLPPVFLSHLVASKVRQAFVVALRQHRPHQFARKASMYKTYKQLRITAGISTTRHRNSLLNNPSDSDVLRWKRKFCKLLVLQCLLPNLPVWLPRKFGKTKRSFFPLLVFLRMLV
ncbi:hypothetical protein TIFTF001_031134 [Ficus carica]|uniref:Uncharacterized protein n=1 Tax=Ficus carica TaxID=3494 RepID=A0AA88DVT8_FICCA|nr:hypothetical protein TIFTF001_031134 [Ficus carica]